MAKLSLKRGQKKLRLANRSEFSLGKSMIRLNYISFLLYDLENMIRLPYFQSCIKSIRYINHSVLY